MRWPNHIRCKFLDLGKGKKAPIDKPLTGAGSKGLKISINTEICKMRPPEKEWSVEINLKGVGRGRTKRINIQVNKPSMEAYLKGEETMSDVKVEPLKRPENLG